MKNMTRYDDLAERDKKNLLHPQTSIIDLETNGPRIIEAAKGIKIRDAKGHELIDGLAGLWCVNVGYGREELAETMKMAAEKLSYFHSFTTMSNPAQIELAEKLTAMAPGNLSKVFFGSSGSDANDTLMKIVWHYNFIKGRPEKKKIISRKGSYHGTSIAAASLTGLLSFHKPYNLPLPEVRHTEMPHYYRFGLEGESEEAFTTRMADMLEQMILAEGPETVGAFIAEPISGAGGVMTPSKGYFAAIQKVLKKYDILMIADEVICGYGRLGKNFGSDVYGIEPDLMATAKGLTSGYFPMSASFISEEVWEVLKEGSEKTGYFAHGYTYSGHPIGCEVALKNLEIMAREKLTQNAAKLGPYMLDQLEAAFKDNPHVAEIRGHGLVAGVQLIIDKDKKQFFSPARKITLRIQNEAYDRGLTCRNLPTVTTLALSPPLIIKKSEIDDMVGIMKDSFDAVLGNLSKDDLTPA